MELAVVRVARMTSVVSLLSPAFCRKFFFFFQAEDGIRDLTLTGVQTCALPICASSDVVRPGAPKTVIEGAFEFTSSVLSRLLPSLTALGVEAEEGRVVLKREISGEGRSRAWVNGSPTTVSTLAQLGALLADLHGQPETQSLLQSDAHRDILDPYAGAAVERSAAQDAHARLREVERRGETPPAPRGHVQRQGDYLRPVVDELA